MLLAVDTAAGSDVAVLDADGELLAHRREFDTRRHAEVIGRLIEGALADAGITAVELEAVAVGTGPGPFTGLRIGLAAAHAVALARRVPLLPVVSHDAIAAESVSAPALVTTDARRRELYASGYDAPDADGLPVRVVGPLIAKPDELPTDRPRLDAQWVSAAALGRLALRRRALGLPAADSAPLYLRSPDVTMSATNATGRPVLP